MPGILLERDRDPAPMRVTPEAAPSGEALAGTPALGRIGSLEVRLASSLNEIAAAQEIRYRVFYEEMGARSAEVDKLEARDADRFDPICDHLLVFDTALDGPEHRQIVGTYRLLRQDVAEQGFGFYSSDEFEIDKLVARHPRERFLELGRSCVLPEYRSKRTIEVLWHGISAYIRRHSISVMTGCASFPGTIPAAHAEALSFIAQNLRPEPEWSISAVAGRYRAMDLVPPEAVDLRSAMASMPPLIKGYLRIGARFGDGCVVDYDFGTTDIFVVLPVGTISKRYVDYYKTGDIAVVI